MGRLLNPGLGELVDRLTILQLKVLHAPAGAATSHLSAERAQIQMRLDAAGWPRNDKAVVLGAELLQCNAQLWELEDCMERYAGYANLADHPVSQDDCATVGVTIWRQNRRRNGLIQRLNELAGTYAGPEKL